MNTSGDLNGSASFKNPSFIGNELKISPWLQSPHDQPTMTELNQSHEKSRKISQDY
jgi:hypothetical protein